ncbi:MAG TPA: tyrosine-type recombinase/integrase [Candidatus Enterocloster faecavium]|uniref:Tyrosine-type recombinase/integrase n=1 Tax=Candidatus Enterocloster faecavium TaxID=2838560 RepID=A0A9D2L8Z6_9FIRM|nr:tyrosine-type recombinase/integrase [Candidatus Enterocloster faecavium]
MEQNERLRQFEEYLFLQEKSRNTVEKYTRDVKNFLIYANEMKQNLSLEDWKDRRIVLSYKEELLKRYRTTSVNSMVASLNCYLKFIGREDCRVQACRIQRQIFRNAERELTKQEYQRLLKEAKRRGNQRLNCLLQTIGATGIRVSELKFITVEGLKTMTVRICSKGKERVILLAKSLVQILKDYCRSQGIKQGAIFITRSGRTLDRRNIWMEMKKLCRQARVEARKVFPHNLRHLFARCYYEKEKDLVRLADFLGHSSVDITRRYTRTADFQTCLAKLELGLSCAEERCDIIGIMS